VNNTGTINQPLFRVNSLHMAMDEDEQGYYNPIVDAMLVTASKEVKKHEVAHRIFAHSHMYSSTFYTLRQLAGISHALLCEISELSLENNVFISGK